MISGNFLNLTPGMADNLMKVLLKGATIICPSSPFHNQTQDILIEDGTIVKIGYHISCDSARQIKNKGLHISTGWFDSGVSFGEPGYEERETLANGSLTAATNGFTTIMLTSNTNPPLDTHASIGHVLQRSEKFPCQVLVCGALSEKMEGKNLAPLYDMVLAGAIAFGDYKRHVEKPSFLKAALQYIKSFNGIIISYPQINDLQVNTFVSESDLSLKFGLNGNPSITETIAILRDLEILKYTDSRLHLQFISSKESIEIIKKAKVEKIPITCSVGLPHVTFCTDEIHDFDPNFKHSPPLRTTEDLEAIRQGLIDGTIDMVSSMHEPVNQELKEFDFANAEEGSIGLEATFGVLNAIFGIDHSIDFLTRGRKIFQKEVPEIKIGAKANLSLFLPNETYVLNEKHLQSTSKNCMYLNRELKGKVLGTIWDKHVTLNPNFI